MSKHKERGSISLPYVPGADERLWHLRPKVQSSTFTEPPQQVNANVRPQRMHDTASPIGSAGGPVSGLPGVLGRPRQLLPGRRRVIHPAWCVRRVHRLLPRTARGATGLRLSLSSDSTPPALELAGVLTSAPG